MIPFLLAAGAWASPSSAYTACCAAMGEDTCPTALTASGPGTETSYESGAVRLSGLWELSCEAGPGYDPSVTQALQTDPGSGAVLTAMGPAAIACWDAACTMPPDLCMRSFVSGARAVECATGREAGPTSWSTPARATHMPVVLDGRVIRATSAAPMPSAAPAPAPVPAAPATRLAADTPIPNPPPMPCVPNPALREPSRLQVNEGNQAAVSGDWAAAAQNYVAAITIDTCNPFAWADLGEAFLVAGDPAQARMALQTATQLMPQHYQAWTNLGLAEEALGRRDNAAAAFEKALGVKPDLAAAAEGLRRVRGG